MKRLFIARKRQWRPLYKKQIRLTPRVQTFAQWEGSFMEWQCVALVDVGIKYIGTHGLLPSS